MGDTLKTIKEYGVPLALAGGGGVGGVLLENSANANGNSIAEGLKYAFTEGVRTVAPIVGDIFDELGRSVVHIAQAYPTESILALMGAIGTVYMGHKRGYIRNPISRK